MSRSLQRQKTLAHLDTSLDLMRSYLRVPLPADPFDVFAWDMAGAHGMILLGLRNIYEKARHVAEEDQHDFVLYALSWVHVVDHHHGLEEAWYFAALNGAVKPEQITHEHDGFRAQIHDLQAYLTACLPSGTVWGLEDPEQHTVKVGNREVYDGKRLEELTEKLVEVFVDHFCAEPAYLTAEKLRPYLSHEEIVAVKEKLKTELMAKPTAFHVWAYLHRPSKTFPPMPGFVKLLCRWVWYWPERRLWRFAPKIRHGHQSSWCTWLLDLFNM